MLDELSAQIEQAVKSWQPPPQAAPPTNDAATTKSVIDDLRDGGTLSRSLEGYQERAAQIQMAQLVETAIREEKHALMESATGTGKSLSYLIPLIRSDKKGIVSTANKALQEQLYYKDVPFCQQHIQNFEAVLLKGKNNYLCLQRFETEKHEGVQVYAQDKIYDHIEESVDNPTWSGDFETLPFNVPYEVKQRINVDENECARRKCPAYHECYYYQLREKAQRAQVIITNHDTLLLSVQAGSRLLPSHDVTIIDEAHTLETVATKQLAVQIRASQIYALLRLQRIKNYTAERTREQCREQAEKLFEFLESFFPHKDKERVALTAVINEGISLARTIERLSNQLMANKPQGLDGEEGELYKRTISRCDNLAQHVHTVFSVEDSHFVYYLERKNDQISACMSPLDVAPALRDTLFTNKTVICTSATLSTPGPEGPDFRFFQSQTGMDNPEMTPHILPLVFDYKKQAMLYTPNDLPVPSYGKTAAAEQYEQAVATRMQQLVQASRGRAFLLFSSRYMLNSVASHIVPTLNSEGFTIFQQGDMPTTELLKQFRSSSKGVLLGLKTFWEGVDVRGEALSLVVIDRLPFPPTEDPTIKAKLNFIDNSGQNPFRLYTLPQITLQIKQAIGRLIRSSEDEGVMAILDVRLHTKWYGASILACMPPSKRSSDIQHVRYFFSPIRQDIRNFYTARKILAAHGPDQHTFLPDMSNTEIARKMQQIVDNEARSPQELAWLQKGVAKILASR
jgi:Rad3-related DNA helicase